MLYYNRIDISKGIDVAQSNNSKECISCHDCFPNHGFEFQILLVMVVVIWKFYVLMLATLLLLPLKMLIIVLLFITLANLKQFIC